MKNPNTIVAGHLELKGRFESACRVFDTEGIAPTQNTAQGWGLETYIIEYRADNSGKDADKAKIEYAGVLTHEGKPHQQDYIMSPSGICKCLSAGSHLNMAWMHLIVEYESDKSLKGQD